MSPIEILAFLALGAFLGATGQLARVLVGVKKNYKTSKKWFDLKRLIISTIIGSVAGTLTAIFFIDQEIDKTLLFAVVAAGYAGTDAIEGIIRKKISH